MSEPTASDLAGPAPEKSAAVDPGDWLERTFNEMRDELVSSLYFQLGSQDDAQDIAQEVFLRCWRTRDRLGDVQNLKAWIYRIALNAARDHRRSAWKRRVKTVPGTEGLPRVVDSSPSEALEEQEMRDRIRKALLRLRPEEKEVYLLRENGVTYEQIAEMLGRPVGTIKTQMRSAIQKLRAALAPEGAGGAEGASPPL